MDSISVRPQYKVHSFYFSYPTFYCMSQISQYQEWGSPQSIWCHSRHTHWGAYTSGEYWISIYFFPPNTTCRFRSGLSNFLPWGNKFSYWLWKNQGTSSCCCSWRCCQIETPVLFRHKGKPNAHHNIYIANLFRFSRCQLNISLWRIRWKYRCGEDCWW